MEDGFADLLPLFVSEVRERLERLVELVGQLDTNPSALAEIKRELHTVKGAARMMSIAAVADLAHAAETLIKTPRSDVGVLLVRAADRLVGMVEVAGTGALPEPDPELVALLTGPRFGDAAAPVPPPPTLVEESMPAPVLAVSSTPPPHPPPAPRAAAPGPAPAPRTGADLRLDATRVDLLSEQATRLRLLALGGQPLAERLYELAELAEQGVREPMPQQVLALLASTLRRAAVDTEGAQRRLLQVAEAQFEAILDLQLQPLRPFLSSLSRHARELARQLDREVEVDLVGEDTRLDRRISRELEAALVHLVRNAVDHGIEPPAARLAAGKAAGGRLEIAATSDGARVRLTIADDGRGIDAAAVRAAAVAGGLVAARDAAAMSDAEALRLVFLLGLSTRGEESEVSGRGIGLDAVWMAVTRLGGEVAVTSSPGRGTTFALEVPAARRGEQVMVLQAGRLHLALPRTVIERVSALPADQVLERGGQVFARLPSERLVPFVPLARVLGEVAAASGLLLHGTVGGQPLAILVDHVAGEEEVLVRPLPRLLGGGGLLEGVALLASGQPVGVLAVAALVRQGAQPLPLFAPRAAPAARRLRLLLVDDSLVTREMERRLLVDAGFEVTAAADATEALTHLGEHAFDCLVTDVEMPGMDGFELVRHLRGIPHLSRLPVVVVSTRDRPEDRLRGLEAGADAYLTKQGLDAGELVSVVRRLAAP